MPEPTGSQIALDECVATIREANDRLREATSGDYMAGESDAAADTLVSEIERLTEERDRAVAALEQIEDVVRRARP